MGAAYLKRKAHMQQEAEGLHVGGLVRITIKALGPAIKMLRPAYPARLSNIDHVPKEKPAGWSSLG
jgi:hypothetical protein